MSEVERYKELFLQAVFADGQSSIRKWVGNFCPIQQLDGVSSGGKTPSDAILASYKRLSRTIIWSYGSLTPYCGIYFSKMHFIVYEERDRIICTFKSGELSENIKPPRIVVSPIGRIICSVIGFDVAAPDLNDPTNARAIARSLGFAAWPSLTIFDVQGERLRPSLAAAILLRTLYSPAIPLGATQIDLTPLLDGAVSEAIERAEANRTFFDPDLYLRESKPIVERW